MKIILSGSIAYDYLMTFPGFFREHILLEHVDTISLSFLVDSMVRMRGGIAPNIAYGMALLGERPTLWATVGVDFEDYRAWLEEQGVDTSGARVIPGEWTASFFVNTDRANSQIASFYPGAMARAAELSLYELAENKPDLVVISPNDPKAMTQYVRECKAMGIPYVYDPSQQIVRLTPEELREGILGAKAVFVNEYEAALIEKATGLTIAQVLEETSFVVVTQGKQGSTVYTTEQAYHIPVTPPEQVADPTGVGDAFRAGFLRGYTAGLDLVSCARMGSLLATYCLEQQGTQGYCFRVEEFVARFRQYFDDQGKLNILLKEGIGNR